MPTATSGTAGSPAEHQSTDESRGLIIRLLIYFLFPTICIQAFIMLTGAFSIRFVFKENSIVEWSQVIVLFGAFVCLLLARRRNPSMRTIFFFLMLLPLIAISRELDSFFNRLVAKDFWKVPAAGLVVCMLYYSLKHHKALLTQTAILIKTRSFVLMFAGFFIAMGYGQLIGQNVFWREVMQEDYIRLVARVFEESTEFVGYCLILAGACECIFERFRTRKQPHA